MNRRALLKLGAMAAVAPKALVAPVNPWAGIDLGVHVGPSPWEAARWESMQVDYAAAIIAAAQRVYGTSGPYNVVLENFA